MRKFYDKNWKPVENPKNAHYCVEVDESGRSSTFIARPKLTSQENQGKLPP